MKHRPSLTVPAPFRGWPHIVEMKQFDREHLEYIWDLADTINPKLDGALLEGDRIGILFDRPSKRTYWSFRLAAERLGAKITADDTMLSDASRYKGETIKSVLDMFLGGNFFKLMVLRLPEDWINRMTRQRVVPVVNAGWDELIHPTQAILDGHAIRQRWGNLDGLKLLMVGNANSRSVRSLAYLLGKFRDVKLTFATLPRYRLDPKLKSYLVDEHDVEVQEIFLKPGDLRQLARDHHGIYDVRLHDERDENVMAAGAKTHEALLFQITQAVVDALPENGFVHHPLPNTMLELTDEVIELNDSRNGGKIIAIEAMADSGIRTRQALYIYLLEEGPKAYGKLT